MVSGHLSVKKGYYYCVLSYNDELGKRKTKWISTGLPEKGNKKKAEALLVEERRKFKPPSEIRDSDVQFADFMKEQWLPSVKGNIELTTYSSYQGMLNSRIYPYFHELGVSLADLKPKHIQDFYTMQSKRVKPATVKHYNAIIHEALEWAVKLELILFNPADRVTLPRNRQYIPEYYTAEELQSLFECIKGDEMELLIRMVCFYGLRKSEVLGLKWSAINFDEDTFVIRHVVTKARVDGKKIIVRKDRPKRKASYRTMPLVDAFKQDLLEMKRKQTENRKLCGNSYYKEDEEYVFVDTMGYLFDPERVSRHFKAILKKNGLKEIRFHDTRHSAGSALCQSGVNMKEIQEWLGHSDFSTTANIYSHLRSDTKISTAASMMASLGMENEKTASEDTVKSET
ncbi:Site-specific recombinase XerD [Butyrivibrio sp. INlla18]|uniref:tyrosine-type recombinase/integrase n=1 Tax=Butyrivibrio sp. INlla18 TaxID=1520806 RepID=UPI0008854A83|nr:site-specific integrase [Butyrivibrio sp. INlla18]SDA79263.1 Site-specific recombinase XerD [Butyrivibrio sp. INlla18]